MKFFSTLESIRAASLPYGDPFILQWEIPNPKDNRERMYIVYNGVEEYERHLKSNRYTTCHEVFLSQTYNKDDEVTGHPAFDIDRKQDPNSNIPLASLLPAEWQNMLRDEIISSLCRQYPQHTEEICTTLSDSNSWVWMSSPSDKKISKHLVLKGITFTTWRQQMKILVEDLLNSNLDKSIKEAIDEGILRKAGSLRLPLNTKKPKVEEYTDEYGVPCTRLHTSTLQFDNKAHSFLDGLVLIHDANMHTLRNSILLTASNLAPEYQEKCTYISPSLGQYDYEPIECNDEKLGLIGQALNNLNKMWNTGLEGGDIQGTLLPLKRVAPGKCPISGKMHDSDNGYIFLKGDKVYFSCHRGCAVHIDGKDRKIIDITPPSEKYHNDIAYSIHCNLDV